MVYIEHLAIVWVFPPLGPTGFELEVVISGSIPKHLGVLGGHRAVRGIHELVFMVY